MTDKDRDRLKWLAHNAGKDALADAIATALTQLERGERIASNPASTVTVTVQIGKIGSLWTVDADGKAKPDAPAQKNEQHYASEYDPTQPVLPGVEQ